MNWEISTPGGNEITAKSAKYQELKKQYGNAMWYEILGPFKTFEEAEKAQPTAKPTNNIIGTDIVQMMPPESQQRFATYIMMMAISQLDESIKNVNSYYKIVMYKKAGVDIMQSNLLQYGAVTAFAAFLIYMLLIRKPRK